MKSTFIMILISASAFADAGVQTLHYKFRGDEESITVKAPSFVDAIERGAQECMHHYTEEFGLSFEEQKDLVNVCANPR